MRLPVLDSTDGQLSGVGFMAAAVGLAVVSREGILREVNHAYCELVHRDRAGLVGSKHPLFADEANWVRLQQLLEGDRPDRAKTVELEVPYQRADGNTAWAAEVFSAAGLESGEPSLVMVARDISLEKAHELEATRFKCLSDETSEAHLLINAAGGIVYANNAATVITGLERDALLKRNIVEVWDALSPAEFRDLFAAGAQRRLPPTEAMFRGRDGSTRPVKIAVSVADFGGEKLLSALVRDRSEQMRVREALRETEARLRIAVDLAELSVYGWDPATGALQWDARLKAIWGLPADALVNFDVFWSGVHPEDRPAVERALQRTLDPADGFYRAEFRVIGLRDGKERWVLACGQTFFKDGKPVGYIGAARDVSARKRTEKSLEEAVAARTAELSEALTELESFSYSISHDMRAPLRAMQGFAQILEEECRDRVGAHGQEYIRRIVTAADRMDRLIQDALTYSRLTRKDLPMENVDLAALVNGILEGYPQLQAPAAEITVQLPLPQVRGNVAALTQCLSNLLGNAVKFVAPGVMPKVRIAGSVTGSRVRVEVHDNGIGIDPAVHEKIFQLFYRLDPKREGTGLGLAVARRAARRMGGDIRVASEPGHGSTFTLELEAASWN